MTLSAKQVYNDTDSVSDASFNYSVILAAWNLFLVILYKSEKNVNNE